MSNKFPNYKIVPFRITYTKKRCSTCNKIKLLKEFSKDKSRRDGYCVRCKKCKKQWRNNNKEHIMEYEKSKIVRNRKNKRERERKKTDIGFRLNRNMSAVMRKSLKGMKNGAPLKTFVDYDTNELKKHLESLFTEGMSWDNYGYGKYKWNIDHIIAMYYFNITSNTCQAFKDCWALKNLQPLWQTRNFEKGDRPMEPKYLIKPF